MFTADFSSFCLYLGLFEFQTPCSSQNRAAALNDVGYVDRFHLKDFLIEQSLVAAHDALDLYFIVQGFSDHCADRSIHTGSIAAARKHANCIKLFFCCHKYLLLHALFRVNDMKCRRRKKAMHNVFSLEVRVPQYREKSFTSLWISPDAIMQCLTQKRQTYRKPKTPFSGILFSCILLVHV